MRRPIDRLLGPFDGLTTSNKGHVYNDQKAVLNRGL